MSRRSGQSPSVRIGKRADGSKYFYFQYYVDVAGQEERQRRTEVLGAVGKMTASEAKRRRTDFLQKLGVNSADYRIPSSQTFAAAVKRYREEYAPMNLRDSTISVAESHITQHLEEYWKHVPVDHITIDKVKVWAWEKRRAGLSWVTIKNILRTMQRVLTFHLNRKKHPPFSLVDLDIPEQDKMEMKLAVRKAASFSWAESKRIADAVRKLDGLDKARKRRYATLFILAAATGLRCSELFALRMDDLDFRVNTVRVDEAFDGRTYKVGPVKNVAADRDVFLGDREGREAFRILKAFVGRRIQNPSEFVFHSKHGSPLRETKVLHDGLHPALKAAGLRKAGMHAFRRGCNRRWELAGVNPAVHRQMMGHSSSAMTVRYSGEIPLAEVQAAFTRLNGPRIVVSENKENRHVA
jgi:integrase